MRHWCLVKLVSCCSMIFSAWLTALEWWVQHLDKALGQAHWTLQLLDRTEKTESNTACRAKAVRRRSFLKRIRGLLSRMLINQFSCFQVSTCQHSFRPRSFTSFTESSSTSDRNNEYKSVRQQGLSLDLQWREAIVSKVCRNYDSESPSGRNGKRRLWSLRLASQASRIST